MSKHLRILFLLKQKQTSAGWCGYSDQPASSGLYNSATFVVSMLKSLGYIVELVHVVDANDIDREVHKFNPTHVVLEAIWVPPTKFKDLTRIHPKVKWTVRIHSEIPFLANEGMALTWLLEYVKYVNVGIAANSLRALNELRAILSKSISTHLLDEKVQYLPNFYPPITNIIGHPKDDKLTLDVGCFGAIRPMKNQLIQAVAAVEAAEKMGKNLRFHINGTRIEQGGENVLKNIKALMEFTKNELVIEPWVDHESFLKLIAKMDIGLQVSFSETFNIVAADMVSVNIPVVLSSEVYWASSRCVADPTDSNSIARAILHVLDCRVSKAIRSENKSGLRRASFQAKEAWEDYLS